MRWQNSDLSQLPQALVKQLASGNYRQAAIGSCPAQVMTARLRHIAWPCCCIEAVKKLKE